MFVLVFSLLFLTSKNVISYNDDSAQSISNLNYVSKILLTNEEIENKFET